MAIVSSFVTNPEPQGLLPRLRAWFGLSQPGLGRCLGLSPTMISQVERGVRGLPLSAALPQAALTLARQQVPEHPTAELPDAKELLKQQRACLHHADNAAFALTRLPERAAWARRRLAALPILRATLTPAGTPPWLAAFEDEARAELARSGSTAQARLRARHAGLLAEAAELAQLLAGDGDE